MTRLTAGLMVTVSAALQACLPVCCLLIIGNWGQFYLQWVKYISYVHNIRDLPACTHVQPISDLIRLNSR